MKLAFFILVFFYDAKLQRNKALNESKSTVVVAKTKKANHIFHS